MAKTLLAGISLAALVAFFGMTETGRTLGCRAVADSATCTLQAAERLGYHVEGELDFTFDVLEGLMPPPAPRKDIPTAKQWNI
jgi:hypothetical protein